MHPVTHKCFSAGRLRLCNLIFMVRKHQVFATRMQIESLAQIGRRHGRAFNMPARPSRPRGVSSEIRRAWPPSIRRNRGRCPCRIRPHRRGLHLPYRPDLFLRVCRIQENWQSENSTNRFSAIGAAALDQLLNQAHHQRNIFGGSRQKLRLLDAQRLQSSRNAASYLAV